MITSTNGVARLDFNDSASSAGFISHPSAKAIQVTANLTTTHQRASLRMAKDIAQLNPAAANRMVAYMLKQDIGTAGLDLADETYRDQQRHKDLTDVLCKDDRANAVVSFVALRSKFRWLTASMLLRALLILRTPIQDA